MTGLRLLRVVAIVAALSLAAACAAPPASPAPTDGTPTGSPQATATSPTRAEPLIVVATTTVLADFVRQVGGERVSAHAIIPAGRDAHTYDPSPSDAILLAGADLLVMNGLGLDEWLEVLADDAAAGVPLVVLGEGLEGVEYLEGDDDEREDEHAHAVNPHLWLDVSNARRYIERLATTLVALDPDAGQAYEANTADYDASLAELDDWIREQVGSVPEDNRRVVSFHDALPYFAHAYGIEIVGVVVESPGQEPSAGEVARLVTAIRGANVRAILTEVQFSDRLAQAIADETGVSVIHDLYTDSLGDAPLDTYEGAMRWNVARIVEGLR